MVNGAKLYGLKMFLQYFWFIICSTEVVLCTFVDHKATDVILKRSGDNLVVNLTLNDELISLKLYKRERSIPSSVPMYVSENGLVEQVIPDLYEEDLIEEFADVRQESTFLLRKNKLLQGVFLKDGEEYIIKETVEEDQRSFRYKRSVRRQYGTNRHVKRRNKHWILNPETKPGAFPLPDLIDISHISKNQGKRKSKYFDTTSHNPQSFTHVAADAITQRPTTYVPPTVKVIKRDYYVELFLVLDNTVYEAWYNISKEKSKALKRKEALDSIRYYFTHVVQGMDERYQSIEEDDFSVQIKLSGFFISTRPSDCPWITDNIESEDCVFADNCTWTYVNAYKAIAQFYDWLYEQRRQLPRLDYAILYTRYDLAGVYSKTYKRRISGTTEIKGICSYKKAAIIEDVGLYGTTQTSTHELGHSLGAYHDADGNNCSKFSQYVMASDPGLLSDSIFNNPLAFSNCSVAAFRKWFNQLNSEGGNCLLNLVDHIEPRKFREQLLTLPGLIYNPDEQCRYLFGNVSYHCRVVRSGGLDICSELFCYMPDLPSQKGCFTTNELRGNPGTFCDDKKLCKKGRCVYDERAPSLEEHCEENGDFPGLWQNGQTCSELIRAAHRRCYSIPFKLECCKTCAELRTPMYKGCEYGDHKSWCGRTKRSQCYNERTRTDCCETCRYFETDIPGCKYGDRASWCANISTSECYVNADTCCQTCAQLKREDDSDCPYGDKSLDCWNITLSECYYMQSHCCVSCNLRRSSVISGCPFGDRKECMLYNCLNPGNWKDCCHTCSPENGYIHGVTQVNISDDEREHYRKISQEAAAKATTIRPTTTTIEIPTTTARIRNYGEPWRRVTPPRRRRKYKFRTRRPTIVPIRVTTPATISITTSTRPTTTTTSPTTKRRSPFQETTVSSRSIRPHRQTTKRRHSTAEVKPTTFVTSTTPDSLGGCGKQDEEAWCYRARARDCYANEKICCYTCPKLKREQSNCEYGDRVSWCEQFVSSYRDCVYDSMEHTCCLTCAALREKPYKPQQRQLPATRRLQIKEKTATIPQPPTTQQLKRKKKTTQQPKGKKKTTSTQQSSATKRPKKNKEATSRSECKGRVDEFWCRSLHRSYCYEIQVRELCCNSCEHYRKTVTRYRGVRTGCEWGDKQTWCDTVSNRDCQYPHTKQTCCDSCS